MNRFNQNLYFYNNLDDRFEAAAKQVDILKERLSNDVLLKLYGLYKQSLNGNNRSTPAGMLDFKGKAKWDAWKLESGKGKTKAKNEYIELVNQIIKYGNVENLIRVLNFTWKNPYQTNKDLIGVLTYTTDHSTVRNTLYGSALNRLGSSIFPPL
jgi:diazepam-binding inhibitor (GABA receptor modulating acyl-CoA-binding protein)